MFLLLLYVVGAALVLGVLFTAGVFLLQPTLYSEPVEGAFWRGPAAGAAAALVLGVWVLLARATPDGRYETFLNFSARSTTQYDDLWIVGPDGTKVVYKLTPTGSGAAEYRRNGRPGRENNWPSRPPGIFVKEDGQEIEFKPDRDEKGNYKPGEDGVLSYRDARGRVMTDKFPGQLNPVRWGSLFLNVLLHVLLFAVLLAGLWLLVQFQFWHAFGMAVALWLVLVLFVVQPFVQYAQTLGRAAQG